jgi:hypothetical protein
MHDPRDILSAIAVNVSADITAIFYAFSKKGTKELTEKEPNPYKASGCQGPKITRNGFSEKIR